MKRRPVLFIVMFLTIFYCSQCRRSQSPEDVITLIIMEIGKNAENHDSSGILKYLDEDFSDMENRNLVDIEGLLEDYFTKFKGIVFHLLGKKVSIIDDNSAEAQVEISLSSGIARVFRKMIKYSGSLYRFKVDFVKRAERWKIHYAEWEYITLDELFPGSTKIFEKLFGTN